MTAPADHVFAGELLRYPGPYAFWLGKQGIILTRDEELETLARDPDAVLDLSLTFDRHTDSLRAICERAEAAGQRTLLLSFDHFFKQYRPGTDAPRRLMPDTDEYIQQIGRVAAFARGHGLSLELSLLSPLEVGPGYRRATGESGVWMHYRKGLRDPETGAFSVQLWRQTQWVNNKGPLAVEEAGVRVFAFRERRVPGLPYLAVDPADIGEITAQATVDIWPGTATRHGDFRAVRVHVHGAGGDVGPLDRVLVVQRYRTPEMDYFSDRAAPFLRDLVDRYVAAGIHLNALYSDEMHIQQDWNYFGHHDHGEFALRYVSDGFQRRFAERYGPEYGDFARWLVYFCAGQEDDRGDLAAKSTWQHVLGSSPEDIRRTSLLRSRYYALLQDGTVDLFCEAKRYAETKMGNPLESRAHATWAESPTIDYWDIGDPGVNANTRKYEYTPDFVWSVTVHQAAAACHDYFKWGEFLTGTGNDHSEGGWLDRDYYGLALGCSTGIINEVPYSYAAHWGSPREVSMRHGWLQMAYGTASSPWFGMVQNCQHRDVEVLMLYPLDLVAADERFGSWMTQYGYANYLTSAKVLELGRVDNGALVIAGRRFTTLCALFEPHPPAALLGLMRQLLEAGGRVIWSGPPPILSAEGEPLLAAWQDLFGVDAARALGTSVPGQSIRFEGPLAGVAPQVVLTDFTVDRAYPLTARDGTQPAARVAGHVVGAVRPVGAGTAAVLGFRPRDDQSRSLGEDVRTWFDALTALGAYPPTGRFAGINDNPEFVSRSDGPYLFCRFPNGAVSAAPHLRHYVESWPGGFGRKPEDDARYVADNPPPSPDLVLEATRVAGHTVDYRGQGAMCFRLDAGGELIAFVGHWCRGIGVDGRTWEFSANPLETICFAPVPPERRVPGGALMTLAFSGSGEVRIPAAGLPAEVVVVAEGAKPASRGEVIPSRRDGDALVIALGEAFRPRLLMVVPR